MRPVLLFVLAAAGCADPTYTDTGPQTDSDNQSDTGSATGSESGTETETETETETDPPPIVTRFVALGDGGEGNVEQAEVAKVMKQVCDRDGCDFALYLGDNFYDSGVDGIDDTQWYDKFEKPYADLTFPFYAALGNHDNGGFGGAGFEFWKGDIQIDYAASGKSDKFRMPDRYYTFKPDNSNVRFIGLDSNAMMFDRDLDDQAAFVDRAMGLADSDYIIAFGHHPYISNGQHGNAGRYEGIPYLPIVSGDDVKDFMDDHICGRANMYISGHDHNRQWLETTCGTEFIVSGAAAKTTDLKGRGNTTLFEDDSAEGFLWVEIVDRSFTGRFYNLRGEMEYEQRFTF